MGKMRDYSPTLSARFFRAMCSKCKAILQSLGAINDAGCTLECPTCWTTNEILGWGKVPLVGVVDARMLRPARPPDPVEAEKAADVAEEKGGE